MKNSVNIADLKAHVDVVELLCHYGIENIQDKGKEVVARCPFHDDHQPSFNMKKGDTFYYCWACQAKGDAITFVMHLDQLDFQEAVSKLSAITGYNVTEDARMEYLKNKFLTPKESSEEELVKVLAVSSRLYELNWWAKLFFEDTLTKHPNDALEYLFNRGFRIEDIVAYSLGYYDPNANFIEEAKAHGFMENELVIAGFLVHSPGNADYERFSDRIMFPIYMKDGDNVIAFSGRAIREGQEPKYTASPNSDYYKKGLILYGLQNLTPNKEIILVEGNLDCIRLHTEGFNSVARLGTALTKEQCSLLKELTDTVILLSDSDEAGRKASYNSIIPLIENEVWVEIAMLPSGDPDTFVREKGPEALREIVYKKMISPIHYYAYTSVYTNRTPEATMLELLRAIKTISDESLKELYLTDVVKVFGYSAQSINIEMKKI